MAHDEFCKSAPGGQHPGNPIIMIYECPRCLRCSTPEQLLLVAPEAETATLERWAIVCDGCQGDIEVAPVPLPPGSIVPIREGRLVFDWLFWSVVIFYTVLAIYIAWKLTR